MIPADSPDPGAGPLALAALALHAGQVAIWWLGQASFALRGGAATVLIDPFLDPHPERLAPPPFAPAQARGVDLILYTHEHFDHLDLASLPAILVASPQARVVVPRPIIPRLTQVGLASGRVIGAQPDEVVAWANTTVYPVPARHGVEVEDAYTFGQEQSDGMVRYLGYVVELNGVRLYHAGDTIAYSGIERRLQDLRIDVALLPINGRDHYRETRHGIVGNLDHREAARLAAETGADLLIPMHYEMFARNRGYPAHLVDIVQREHPGLSVLIPGKERPFVYTRTATKPATSAD